MNLTGGTTFSGPLRYKLENYFPEAHYKKAVDQAFDEETAKRLETDGGGSTLHSDGRRSNVYYWVNPDTGAALYHTEINGDEAHPFFSSINEAEDFLENRADDEEERYQGFSLYKAKIRKVEDAVEVLMNQSDINDFW